MTSHKNGKTWQKNSEGEAAQSAGTLISSVVASAISAD